MRTLSVNSVHLLELLDPSHAFVTELASPTTGCITWSQRDHLISMIQPRDCNKKLIEFLTRRSIADFTSFIKILSKEQAHLVRFLVTNGGQ